MQKLGWLVAGALIFTGCGTSPSPARTDLARSPCRVTADCPSGEVCSESICLSCAELPAGMVCIDGVAASCSTITDGSHCFECPSSCSSSQHCDDSDTCVALAPVGGPCTANADCASGNCGLLAGADGGALQCFVAAGSPCTADNCGSCVVTGSTTSCDQSCTASADITCGASVYECPSGETVTCLGENGSYFCRRPCGFGDCPTGYTCEQYETPLCSDVLFANACYPDVYAQPPTPVACSIASGCPSGAVGYACTGGAMPSTDAGVTSCRAGGKGEPTYCCATDACFVDPSVASSFSCSGTVYACGGQATPSAVDDEGHATLCTALFATAGSMSLTDYCCMTPTCTQSSSLPCNGAIGYMCTGSVTPDQVDPGLACPTLVVGGASPEYCCEGILYETCAPDVTFACGPTQFGMSCSSAAPSDQLGTTVTCTLVANQNQKEEYCCDSPTACVERVGFGSCNSGTELVCPTDTAETGLGTTCTVNEKLGPQAWDLCCQ